MQAKSSCEIVSDYISLCGEGPLWDSKTNYFYWIDIVSGMVHILSDKNELTHFETNQKIGAIGLTESGKIIAALKTGLYHIDVANGFMKLLIDPEFEKHDNRFNDGKCDPAGRFWEGTMSDKGVKGQGNLYTLEKNKTITTKLQGLSISNGMAWDINQRKYYHIDTPTRQIVAYDYCNESGVITKGKSIIEISEAEGVPDGMTIDEDGMLWVAHWNGGKVSKWNPRTKKKVDELFLPVSKVTSCAFGGEALEDLYVTTARLGLTEKEMDEQPLAGATFVFKNVGARGIPTYLVEDSSFL